MTLLVLVVDDEPDIEALSCQQFRRELRDHRFNMEFAQSAPAALQRSTNDVPIIMVTAYGDAETKGKAMEGGAEALLTKPIDFSVLRNEIETRVQRVA